jgi:hypothetical protein
MANQTEQTTLHNLTQEVFKSYADLVKCKIADKTVTPLDIRASIDLGQFVIDIATKPMPTIKLN